MHKIISHCRCVLTAGMERCEGKQIPYLVKLRPAKESSAFLGAWSRDWYSCDQGLGSFPLIFSPGAPRGADGNIKISPCPMFFSVVGRPTAPLSLLFALFSGILILPPPRPFSPTPALSLSLGLALSESLLRVPGWIIWVNTSE